MSMMFAVKPSPTPGRFCVGQWDLTSGDVITFVHNNTVLTGRIEHDSTRGGYFVVAGETRLPLRELVYARYVGHGRGAVA
jgi:Domain of unknown function (DUF5348)